MIEPAPSPVPGSPVVLVTGGARRIGASIARVFHERGYRVLAHCRHSITEAESLVADLNQRIASSAAVLVADLAAPEGGQQLAESALQRFGRVDVLINNASGYFPIAFGEVNAQQWDELHGSNLRGHFFLSQALGRELRARGGAIVNIVDIHADRPRRGYSVYSIAKAGLKAMTRALAVELAPSVRVNAIAPGAILWPENLKDETAPGVAEARRRILQSIPLRRLGEPAQLAELCFFLATEASYVTGQTIRMDGGRLLGLA